jgi:uncharacterized protein (DUF1786 family)
MRILAIDIGTGTQDLLLFDTSMPVENAVKLVLPSPTEIAARRVRRATAERRALVLTGATMGGGPSHWAVEDHLRAGYPVYATLSAAQTFDDDPDQIRRMGITLVSEEEAAALAGREGVAAVELRDLDLASIRRALQAFEVEGHVDGLALGCLDHGAAPPGVSDRLFRFEHLRAVVSEHNDLTAFAYLPHELPDYLTRARALMRSADVEAAAVFLDTGPAAALGALQDERVGRQEEQFVLNLGNMHALGFHLRGRHICSLFEHHTGEVSREQIEDFCRRLIAGTLRHEDVYDTKGHGVFYADEPHDRAPLIAVTGPQRGKLRGGRLNPYQATPHGDMMLSGCFGLVVAFAAKYPQYREEIEAALGA